MKNIENIIKKAISSTLKDPQIFKFMIIGIGNALLLLLLTIFFTEYLSIYYVISSIIAYEITIITGFIVNEYWTFAKIIKTETVYTRFVKYNIFYFFGLIINSILVFVLTDFIEIDYSSSQIIAIGIVFVFNFTTSKKISFKN
ncbi:GtrA family protein [Nitrosopumilus sp.]|uniref:GtrA family protein n=1 Tax=Nitrosopumilus sp. TaxID=2024843 RepID=UPI003D0D4727